MYSSFSSLIRYQFLKTVKEFFQQDSNSIDSVSIDLPQQPSSPINIPNHRTRNPIESHLVKSHSSIVSLVERERACVSPQNGVVWGRRGYERVHQRRTSRKLQREGPPFSSLPPSPPPSSNDYIYIYIYTRISLSFPLLRSPLPSPRGLSLRRRPTDTAVRSRVEGGGRRDR